LVTLITNDKKRLMFDSKMSGTVGKNNDVWTIETCKTARSVPTKNTV